LQQTDGKTSGKDKLGFNLKYTAGR